MAAYVGSGFPYNTTTTTGGNGQAAAPVSKSMTASAKGCRLLVFQVVKSGYETLKLATPLSSQAALV